MIESETAPHQDDDAVSRVLARAASKSAGYTLFGSGNAVSGNAQACNRAESRQIPTATSSTAKIARLSVVSLVFRPSWKTSQRSNTGSCGSSEWC